MTSHAGLVALQVRPGHPDFLDLPWDLPLARWAESEGAGRDVGLERALEDFLRRHAPAEG